MAIPDPRSSVYLGQGGTGAAFYTDETRRPIDALERRIASIEGERKRERKVAEDAMKELAEIKDVGFIKHRPYIDKLRNEALDYASEKLSRSGGRWNPENDVDFLKMRAKVLSAAKASRDVGQYIGQEYQKIQTQKDAWRPEDIEGVMEFANLPLEQVQERLLTGNLPILRPKESFVDFRKVFTDRAQKILKSSLVETRVVDPENPTQTKTVFREQLDKSDVEARAAKDYNQKESRAAAENEFSALPQAEQETFLDIAISKKIADPQGNPDPVKAYFVDQVSEGYGYTKTKDQVGFVPTSGAGISEGSGFSQSQYARVDVGPLQKKILQAEDWAEKIAKEGISAVGEPPVGDITTGADIAFLLKGRENPNIALSTNRAYPMTDTGEGIAVGLPETLKSQEGMPIKVYRTDKGENFLQVLIKRKVGTLTKEQYYLLPLDDDGWRKLKNKTLLDVKKMVTGEETPGTAKASQAS